MKRKIDHRKWVSILVILLAFLVQGCSSTSTEAPVQENEAAAETPADAAVQEPTAVEDTGAETEQAAETDEAAEDIFRISMLWDTWTADPAHAYGSWAGDFMFRMAYEPLLKFRGTPYEPELRLAESYEVNDDFTEWTFKLRPDAVFHDGTPVTAEDVKYSWDRANLVGADVSTLWGGLADADSAEIIDDQTIKFTMISPFSDFLSTLPFFYIVNADLVRQNAAEGDFGEEGDYGQAWLAENEAGSGPFVWDTYEPNTQHGFTALDDYWFGWPNPDHMDRIIVKIIPSSNTQKLSLIKGDIDWAGDLEPEDFLSLDGEAGVKTGTRGTNYYVMQMNNAVGPTSDPNVRKAIAYAFNYDSMAETVLGQVPQGIIGPNVPGFEAVDMPSYDLDKAKEFLAQSAYPDGGFDLTYRFLADYKPDEIAGLLLQEGLAELNINVELIPTEWTQYYEICASPETATSLTGDFSTLFSTAMILNDRYNSENWGTITGCSFYKNDEVDSLLVSYRTEPDDEKLAQVQRLVAEDVPNLILFNYGLKEAYTDRLQGLGENHPYPYPAFPEDLYYGTN